MCTSNGDSQVLVLQVFISCEKEDAHFFILHGVPGNVFECGCERNQVIRISWLLNQCNDRCFERYNPILLAQPCELIRDRVYLFRKDTLQVHKKYLQEAKQIYYYFIPLSLICIIFVLYLHVNVQSFCYKNIISLVDI